MPSMKRLHGIVTSTAAVVAALTMTVPSGAATAAENDVAASATPAPSEVTPLTWDKFWVWRNDAGHPIASGGYDDETDVVFVNDRRADGKSALMKITANQAWVRCRDSTGSDTPGVTCDLSDEGEKALLGGEHTWVTAKLCIRDKSEGTPRRCEGKKHHFHL